MSRLRVLSLGNLAIGSPEANEWDRMVSGDRASGFMQSLPWTAFRRSLGYTTLHLGAYDGDDLIGGAICHSIRSRSGGSLLVVPEGPILPWECEERARELLRMILDEVRQVASDVGAIAFRIEPRLSPPKPRLLRGLRRSPVDLIPQETMYLDLTAAPEEILRGMRPKGRYNVGLSARRGVTVTEETDASYVTEFYPLLVEAGARDGFFVEPRSFFVGLAEHLCPSRMGRFLLARHEGELLGAMFLVTFGRRGTYLYGGIANGKRNLMAGYALQWAAIRACQRAGCAEYDFYGYEPFGAPSHLYAGFSRFKKQFGGQAVRFIGSQEMFFLDTLTDLVVRAVHEMESSSLASSKGSSQ